MRPAPVHLQGCYLRLRRYVRNQLDPKATTKGLSFANKVLCMLIILAVASAVLETEPTISAHRQGLFRGFELCFGAAFAFELVMRGWCAAEGAKTTRAA